VKEYNINELRKTTFTHIPCFDAFGPIGHKIPHSLNLVCACTRTHAHTFLPWHAHFRLHNRYWWKGIMQIRWSICFSVSPFVPTHSRRTCHAPLNRPLPHHTVTAIFTHYKPPIDAETPLHPPQFYRHSTDVENHSAPMLARSLCYICSVAMFRVSNNFHYWMFMHGSGRSLSRILPDTKPI
jgi:hypothetical protein